VATQCAGNWSQQLLFNPGGGPLPEWADPESQEGTTGDGTPTVRPAVRAPEVFTIFEGTCRDGQPADDVGKGSGFPRNKARVLALRSNKSSPKRARSVALCRRRICQQWPR
jgi:hypothetical protein